MADKRTVVPYVSLFIDTSWLDVLAAVSMTIRSDHRENREQIKRKLKEIFQNVNNRNDVIPCLSVRSGLDLYLRVKKYPVGSQVIMTSVNIPSISAILEHHGLNVVPWDILISTLIPKVDTLKQIITERTVAILIAHIYGRYSNIDDIISVAKQHNLDVIEDCAESFSGLEVLGNAGADISLFSFGIIKHSTAFGGSLVKVHDPDLADKMNALHETYPLQSRYEYMKRVLKYGILLPFLNVPCITLYGSIVARKLCPDYKEIFVHHLHSFPKDLIEKIRHKPSTALMFMMYRRLQHFNPNAFNEGMKKYEYLYKKLPNPSMIVGSENKSTNYWLFPILVSNPTKFIKILSTLGVDAYGGATTLSVVTATDQSKLRKTSPSSTLYPQEAHSLIERVVYLPVHKRVPYHHLDNICSALEIAMETLRLEEEQEKCTKLQMHFRSKL